MIVPGPIRGLRGDRFAEELGVRARLADPQHYVGRTVIAPQQAIAISGPVKMIR